MSETTKPEADFLEYLISGQCPCCFPYWEYEENLSALDLWRWRDKYDAWNVFELQNEIFELLDGEEN